MDPETSRLSEKEHDVYDGGSSRVDSLHSSFQSNMLPIVLEELVSKPYASHDSIDEVLRSYLDVATDALGSHPSDHLMKSNAMAVESNVLSKENLSAPRMRSPSARSCSCRLLSSRSMGSTSDNRSSIASCRLDSQELAGRVRC
jgi:hypothetical protein